MDRKAILLQACLQLLEKQEASHSVLNMLEQTAFYDEAECDGYCLMDDIRDELQNHQEVR